MQYTIHPAGPDDAQAVAAMTRALNEHDKGAPILMTAASFRRDGFGENPAFHVFIAQDNASTPVGYALWYQEYDALGGRRGGYMEDLWVDPAARGTGLARRLMSAVAREITTRGGSYLTWTAKKDNTIANAYYAKVGKAEPEYLAWAADGEDFDALLGVDDGS
jgi:ribosomal protein S18 acetylase RimI-like enzyme